eukprot:scaffold184_cov379-Prasinococcus_capsulatus_cf.AAC.7
MHEYEAESLARGAVQGIAADALNWKKNSGRQVDTYIAGHVIHLLKTAPHPKRAEEGGLTSSL